MSRVIILLISVLAYVTALSQDFIPRNWDDLANNIASGRDEALPVLMQFKEDLEADSEWDKNAKDSYQFTVSLLAEYYSRRGMLKDIEILLKDAMKNYMEKDSVANSSYTRRLLVLITRLQKEMGDPDALLMYGHKALELYEAAEDYGYDFVLLLHNIALGYLVKGDLLSAKLYADDVIDQFMILQRDSEVPWEWGVPFLNTQGLIEFELGHYDEAIDKFKKVIEMSSPDSLSSPYWLAVNNLSSTYTKIGRYEDAKKLQMSIPDEIPLELLRYKNQNLVVLDYLSNDGSHITEHLTAYNNAQNLISLNIADAFSETEREAFFSTWGLELILVNNLAASRFPQTINESFEANLAARSIEVSISRTLKDFVISDSTGLSQKLLSNRNELIKKGHASEHRDSLKMNIIEMEKELLRTNPNTRQSIVNYNGTYDDICRNLAEDEAIVLFCCVPEMYSLSSSRLYYGAYVLSGKDTITRLVKLCDEDEVEDIFYNNDPSIEFVSELYSNEKASKLYELIWAPLEDLLQDVKTIYYSTSGYLGQLNHEALIDNNGDRIGHIRDMRLVSNPAYLPEDDSIYLNGNIALFGSPAFNMSVNDMTSTSSNHTTYSGEELSASMMALRGEVLRDGWSLLPGTREEIESISDVLKEKGSINVEYYVDADATEEAVKALSGNSPTILHIATHGYIISDQTQYNRSNFAQSKSGISAKNNYMLWSGLILSGGNNAWTGKDLPPDVEDGILTSDEISRLDLSKTKLVVLSACETGRGHIDRVDGIWGLQRGFKLAGVQSILMTLWKIPDSTTAMFMKYFYSELSKGKSAREALHSSQKYLIENGASDPFYWASFVIID